MPGERTPTPGTGGIGGVVTGAAALGGPGGAAAVAAGQKVAQKVQAPVDSLDALKDGAAAVRRWVSDRHNWVRVTWFSGGLVCFVVGAVMVAGKPAASAAKVVGALK